MTDIGDIVRIYFEDELTSYARIEDIEPDIKRDWYHLTMRLLQIPEAPETLTWILRDTYINGVEFTMQGKRIRLEKLEAPEALQKRRENEAQENKKKDGERAGQVISFSDFKKP